MAVKRKNALKRLDKRIFFVILFDVIFYVILIAIIFAGAILASMNMNKLNDVTPLLQKALSNVLQGGFERMQNKMEVEEIKEVSNVIKSVIRITNTIIGAAIALTVLFRIFFNSLIWSRILKIRLSRKYFKKYLLLNIGWVVLWSIVLFALLMPFKMNVIKRILPMGIIIYLYFSVILRSLFDEKRGYLDMAKKAFIIGAKKIHLFLFQCIPAVVAGAILAVLFRYSWYNLGNASFKIIGVFSIIYFAWLRMLASKAVKNIQARKSLS